MPTAKTVNYSDADIAVLRAAAPVSFETAAQLAEQLGKTQRSIVAKVKSLDLEYIPKATPKKRVTGQLSKADVVSSICAAVGVESLEGLEKATAASLAALLAAISK